MKIKPATTTQRLCAAFNHLVNPKLGAKKVENDFHQITRATQRDPDAAFAALGETIRTKTIDQLILVRNNLHKISLTRMTLEGATMRVKSEQYAKQYPEMENFFKAVFNPKIQLAGK